MADNSVSSYEVSVLVLRWLEQGGFSKTAAAFKREARTQFKAAGAVPPPGVRNLLDLLNDYVRLKEEQASRVALAAANPLAARVLAALDAEAAAAVGGGAPRPPAAPNAPTACQQQQQQQAAGLPPVVQQQQEVAAPAAAVRVQWVPQGPAGQRIAQQQQFAAQYSTQQEQQQWQRRQPELGHQTGAPGQVDGQEAVPGKGQSTTPGRQRKGAPRKRRRGADPSAAAAAGGEGGGFPAVALFGGGGSGGDGADGGGVWGSPFDLLNLPLDASGLEMLLDDGPLQLAFAEHLAQHINSTAHPHSMGAAHAQGAHAAAAPAELLPDPQAVLAELPADPYLAGVLQQVVRPGATSPTGPPSRALFSAAGGQEAALAAGPGPRAPSRGAGSGHRAQPRRRQQRQPGSQQAGWGAWAVQGPAVQAPAEELVLPIVSLEPPPLRQQERDLCQQGERQQQQQQMQQGEQQGAPLVRSEPNEAVLHQQQQQGEADMQAQQQQRDADMQQQQRLQDGAARHELADRQQPAAAAAPGVQQEAQQAAQQHEQEAAPQVGQQGQHAQQQGQHAQQQGQEGRPAAGSAAALGGQEPPSDASEDRLQEIGQEQAQAQQQPAQEERQPVAQERGEGDHRAAVSAPQQGAPVLQQAAPAPLRPASTQQQTRLDAGPHSTASRGSGHVSSASSPAKAGALPPAGAPGAGSAEGSAAAEAASALNAKLATLGPLEQPANLDQLLQDIDDCF